MKRIVCAAVLIALTGLTGCKPEQPKSDLPAGALVAWVPPTEAIDEAAGSVKLPDGWKECEIKVPDAMSGTGYFLYGGSAKTFLSRKSDGGLYAGGSEAHGHDASISPHGVSNDYDRGSNKDAADAFVQHTVTITPSTNVPPYAAVIWLCKA